MLFLSFIHNVLYVYWIGFLDVKGKLPAVHFSACHVKKLAGRARTKSLGETVVCNARHEFILLWRGLGGGHSNFRILQEKITSFGSITKTILRLL